MPLTFSHRMFDRASKTSAIAVKYKKRPRRAVPRHYSSQITLSSMPLSFSASCRSSSKVLLPAIKRFITKVAVRSPVTLTAVRLISRIRSTPIIKAILAVGIPTLRRRQASDDRRKNKQYMVMNTGSLDALFPVGLGRYYADIAHISKSYGESVDALCSNHYGTFYINTWVMPQTCPLNISRDG